MTNIHHQNEVGDRGRSHLPPDRAAALGKTLTAKPWFPNAALCRMRTCRLANTARNDGKGRGAV